MKYGSRLAAIATLAAMITITTGNGCKSPPPPAPKPAPPAFAVPANRSQATADLVTRTNQFNFDVARFPGKNADEHQQVLAAVLANLSKILRLANGPVESPEFANGIKVIDAAQTTASKSLLGRSRMEAVENQALRAATGALNEIAQRNLFDDTQLPDLLNKLMTQVYAATLSMGPMHDLDATSAFTALQAVVQQTTNDMVDRFGPNASAPVPAATVAPATTMPTSMPASMPTTMP